MSGLRLSAVLVVRDDEAGLAACLQSLTGLVDEVVVYDAGSSDGSRGIARAAGARILDGGWDHDYASARNAALELCHGDWVLSIDPGELVVGADADGLRSWLAHQHADVCSADAHVLSPAEPWGAYHQWLPRLFRRDSVQWKGRVHEHLTAAAAAVPSYLLRLRRDDGCEPWATKARTERDLSIELSEVARLQLADDADALAQALLDLGTDLLADERRVQAMQALLVIRRLLDGGPIWAEATDRLACLALFADHADLTLKLAEELRLDGWDPDYCAWLVANAHLHRGDPSAALTALDSVRQIVDTAGRRFDPERITELRTIATEHASRAPLAS